MLGTLGTLVAQFALVSSLMVQPMDTGPYSAESIWDWSQHFTALPERCPTPAWFDMKPDERVADAGCIAAAMREWGASESAIRFFETTGQFLQSFDEHGHIDSGLASSPWVNDGRGEAVLLNGSPSAMLISRVVGNATEGWQAQPGYADLSRSAPGASAWIEYGALIDTRNLPNGIQELVAWFDMRECRDCPTVAHMPFTLRFDPRGVLLATELLPPQP
ncbi:MAG TPA: hypothetical protein VGL99_10160 [Chloroflexota bacterium]|jgi:hypothetical protein